MAVYYFRNTGDVNWGTATNWSLTDGGGATGAVPTASDDAIFTANSGNCTVNASTRSCLTLTTTGYTNTITITQDLQVFGNVTLGASTILAGVSNLVIAATATITSNGVLIPNLRIGLTTSFTTTLSGDITTNNLLVRGNNGTTFTINSGNIFVSGVSSSFTIGTASITIAMDGTTVINITGTTTLQQLGSAPVVRNSLTINSSGTVTFLGTFRYNTGTLTYTAGNVITDNTTLVTTLGTTFNTGNILWNNVQMSSGMQTIIGNFNVLGLLTLGVGGASTTFNTGTINAFGDIVMVGIALIGTATLNVLGDGVTISSTSSPTTSIRFNLVINSRGQVNIPSSFFFQTSTFTFVSGFVNARNTVLFLTASCTLINMNKIYWGAVVVTSGITVTMNEFFCGSAKKPTPVITTPNTGLWNCTLLNADGTSVVEKIAYYVKVFGMTLTNNMRLLIVASNSRGQDVWNGDSPFSISPATYGRTLGPRYINQSPNYVPKNNPPLGNGLTFPAYGLTSDPSFIF